MTFQEKQEIDKKIAELISSITEGNEHFDAAMYIHGDNQYQNASFFLKGDVRILANTIQHHIQNNEEFRRFMFATIGSYFTGNPEHEKEFNSGLSILKINTGGINPN